MWKNGDDWNDNGDRVRLYQPIAYSSGRQFSREDPTCSYIGGSATATIESSTPLSYCAQCQEPMDAVLLQLHIPSREQTYRVLGCNSAKCVNRIFCGNNNKDEEDVQAPFSVGGGGVFYCWKMDAKNTDIPENIDMGAPPKKEEQVALPPPVEKKEPQTDEWNLDDSDDEQDLEQQIAAMELKQQEQENQPQRPKPNTHSTHKKSNPSEKSSSNGLPCFELHSLLEPPGKTKTADDDEDDDEDDDGPTGGGASSEAAKIQEMLAKYMAEEEDEEILNALRGSTATGSGGGGKGKGKGKFKGQEKDERLNAADRALLAFTNRIKRSPRQVVRYAPNGMPLWSV